MQCGHQGAQNQSTTSEFSKSISSATTGADASSTRLTSVVSTTGSVVVVVGAVVVVVVVGSVVVVVGSVVVDGIAVVGAAVVGGAVVVASVVVVLGVSLVVSRATVEPPHAEPRIASAAITERVNFATHQQCHIERRKRNCGLIGRVTESS